MRLQPGRDRRAAAGIIAFAPGVWLELITRGPAMLLLALLLVLLQQLVVAV
jgi:hypothetical protein